MKPQVEFFSFIFGRIEDLIISFLLTFMISSLDGLMQIKFSKAKTLSLH